MLKNVHGHMWGRPPSSTMPTMDASSPKNLDQQRCTRMQDTCRGGQESATVVSHMLLPQRRLAACAEHR